MSVIKPFCALKPAPDKVKQVASHSVELYTKQQANDIVAHNPVSFLQIIRAGDLQTIRKKLDSFVENKIFIKDASPSFYLYRQVKNNRHHIGIVGLASVDDYNKGVLRIHEQTLEKKEQKLTEYLDVCGFNAEPVCLTYPHHREINALMRNKELTPPFYDYLTEDDTRHSVWLFDTKEETEKISALFQGVPYIYIADGHHRVASSVRLAEHRKTNNPSHSGNESYNFFSAALFADDELTIHNYNRVVRDLNGLDAPFFLNELKKKFSVLPVTGGKIEPEHKGEMSLYLQNNWYKLVVKTQCIVSLPNSNAVSDLDVSILSDNILSPVLNLKDLRNDKRIAFVPGIKSAAEIMNYVDSGKMAAAFCLYPVSFNELLAVADSGKEMPPKSTWVEPKLESGMLIYDLV